MPKALFRIVLEQRKDTAGIEFFPSLQKGELDDKGALYDRAAKRVDQGDGRRRSPAGGDQVVGYEDAGVRREGVPVDLQGIRAVLQLVARAVRLVGKLAGLAHDAEARAQFVSQGGADDEAARLDSQNDVNLLVLDRKSVV